MTGLIFHVLSWPTLAVALLVWGFAPGAVLRLIVLAFPRDDPRRRELLGELYAVPRIERPFWVAEKMELALSEGLGGRLRKVIKRWRPRQRLAEEWQDFLDSRQSLGSGLTAYAQVISLVYLVMFLHGTSRIAAFASWVVLCGIRASYYQHHEKRCKRAGKPVGTNRLDTIIFILLGPSVYIMTSYLMVHDVAKLVSGDMSAGYWIGLSLSILALWQPWEMLRSTLRAARTESAAR